MIDTKLLGNNIMAKRKLQKLTQEELAKKAGVSTIYLQQVEAGKANISINMLNKIIDALEVEFVYKLN